MSDGQELLVEALAGGISELFEADRNQSAEAFGLVLLGVNDRSARDAFLDEIEKVSPISNPALVRATMQVVAQRRHGSNWPHWLDHVSPDVVSELEDGPILLGELGRSLWKKATLDEDPLDGDALTAALASTQRVAGKTEPDRNGLAESIREAVALVPIDEESANAQERNLALADRFASAGLVKREDYALTGLTAIAEALTHEIPPLELNHPVSRHVERWGTNLASTASDSSRNQLQEAASKSAWLQDPFRQTLFLAGSLRENPNEVANPYSEEQILTLVEEYKGWFDIGLAIWIGKIGGQSAASVGRVIAPFRSEEIPAPVVDAIKERFVEPNQRTELAVAALRGMLEQPPDADFMTAIELQDADPGPLVDLLSELYGEVANNEHRESILAVAHGMMPLPDAQRKQLINDIVIPMAHQGKGALDIVLANLEVCLPAPYGTRGKLRETLRERAKDKAQRRRVDDVLLEAGLIRKSGFFGRSRQDVEE